MFDNLNWWEVGLLLLLALLIFGDKLPNVISDGLRMLRNLRSMANSATSDLSRELGTDIRLEDLHPKAFIRKHLLSEEEEAALRKPLQGMYNDIKSDLTGVQNEVKDIAKSADIRSDLRSGLRGGNGTNGANGAGSANGAGAVNGTANGTTQLSGASGATPADGSTGTSQTGPGPVIPASRRSYDLDAT